MTNLDVNACQETVFLCFIIRHFGLKNEYIFHNVRQVIKYWRFILRARPGLPKQRLGLGRGAISAVADGRSAV